MPDHDNHCQAAARLYPAGWRCATHSPARQAGRLAPAPGPGYTSQRLATPQSASALMDDRAIASGKRRSSPERYRLAQQATRRLDRNITDLNLPA
jgi:hypothetical protein